MQQGRDGWELSLCTVRSLEVRTEFEPLTCLFSWRGGMALPGAAALTGCSGLADLLTLLNVEADLWRALVVVMGDPGQASGGPKSLGHHAGHFQHSATQRSTSFSDPGRSVGTSVAQLSKGPAP